MANVLRVEPRVQNVVVNASEYQLLHYGSGVGVVLYPSLGRPGSDFHRLAQELGSRGFHAVAINPPGVTTPLGEPGWTDLGDIANELWQIIEVCELGRVVLVGHAFGNRVVRATSAARPDDVSALVLLACGGDVSPGHEALTNLLKCFDDSLESVAHCDAVRAAFFAPGNEVGEWTDGWFRELAGRQRDAVARTSFEDFAAGGTAPGLIVQGLNDVIAPPQNAWNLVNRRANTSVVGLANCGHAIMPEQPGAVRDAVTTFLRSTFQGFAP
jgi:pimeloyl-ACP methyl ester carboxylesterase